MPFYEKGDVCIHYEETWSGFPLLLIPGGGLSSTIGFFTGNAPFNPIEEFQGEYRVIAAVEPAGRQPVVTRGFESGADASEQQGRATCDACGAQALAGSRSGFSRTRTPRCMVWVRHLR